MSRRIGIWAAMAVALAVAGAHAIAQAPAVWNHWRYAAPIDAGQTASPRLVAVVVPDAVTERAAAGAADLRVLDTDGREVPFELRVRRGLTETVWRDVTILDPSVVAGADTEATIDTGADARVHNAVRVDLSTDGDFLTWVEIAISDDGRSWRVLRDRAPVYDLRDEGMSRAVDVTYPDSVSRYLRVRVLDGTRRYRFAAARVAFERTTTPDLVATPAGFVADDARPQRTTWVSSADVSGAWMSELRFDDAPEAFDRPVGVETSDDGHEWRFVASGEIYRIDDRGHRRESLTLRLPETRAPHWRVTVYDRNDAPLAGIRPVLYASPRRVVFRQEPGHGYLLLYGNSRATAAEYDFARLTDADAIDAATPATLGPERVNDAYEDPAPWTDRHPAVLWTALGLAVLALGFVALRTLRTG